MKEKVNCFDYKIIMYQHSDENRFTFWMEEKKKKEKNILIHLPFKHEIMTLRISASYSLLGKYYDFFNNLFANYLSDNLLKGTNELPHTVPFHLG